MSAVKSEETSVVFSISSAFQSGNLAAHVDIYTQSIKYALRDVKKWCNAA